MKILPDLSHHNGSIDFSVLKNNIDGAILRAGYGNGCLDRQFKNYAAKCNELGIPIGIYWFSYAYSEGMAAAEARACADIIKDYKIDLPVSFDWEQDSWDTAIRAGVTPTKELITRLNRVFCETIAALGYKAGFYYNEDYRKCKLDVESLPFYRWHARYRDSISVECDLWQYTSSGTLPGINGKVDLNKLLNEELLGGQQAPTVTPTHKTNREVAQEVIEGKWGNGSERKERLTAAGYNYEAVQKAVNEILGKKKTNAEIAQEVIEGKWGNGSERKERLTAA